MGGLIANVACFTNGYEIWQHHGKKDSKMLYEKQTLAMWDRWRKILNLLESNGKITKHLFISDC